MSDQLTFFASDSLDRAARPPWKAVSEWLSAGNDFSLPSLASLIRSLPPGWSARRCLEFCRRATDGSWELSSRRWPTAGTASPGGCLTFALSTEPFGNDASSSPAVLEATQDVPQRFFLSRKRAYRLVERLKFRRNPPPESLLEALEVAAWQAPL